jgi:hypothetical protein
MRATRQMLSVADRECPCPRLGTANCVRETALSHSSRCRKLLAASLAAAVFALWSGPVSAQPWSSLGGDPGRSGHQPAETGGGAAVRSLYALTGPEDRGVTTSAITTSGPPGSERVVYGTADGRVHVRRLADGQPVGSPEGIDISNEVDAFSTTPGLGFTETSTPAALGQLYVTHNDAQGVSVAQIDETTGELVKKLPVAPGYTIRSSALLSPPLNGDGDRALFFVALNDKQESAKDRLAASVGGQNTAADGRKLFKVTLSRAHQREAGVAAITDTSGIKANPDASPTLIYLTSNNGAKEAYVAVGTANGRTVTYSVSMLAPGPHHATGGENDWAMTPTVPVTPSGLPPGADSSGRDAAPHFFVTSTDGETTILHRLTRPDTSLRFAVTDSVKLPGAAGLGIATNQLALPDRSSPGLVYVTTVRNLYALDADSLAPLAQFSPTDLAPGTGFARTAPSVTGNFLFAARDNGEQLVLDARTLQRMPAKVFSQDLGNGDAKASAGQPSVSQNRQVLFASDRGLFVYGLR